MVSIIGMHSRSSAEGISNMNGENEFVMSVENAMNRFSTDVYRMAYARTGNKSDAEDITQDTFIKYMKETKPFSDENHVKAWLLRVAINSSKNLVTSAWHRKNTSMDAADLMSTAIEDKSDVYYAVLKLPEKYRIVVHLYYYEGYSVEEIANILSAKDSTVKSWMRRARMRLKELLKEDIDV